MKFRYFESPEKYGAFLEGHMPCAICRVEKKCFDAGIFFGEDAIKAICPDCLAGGGLMDLDIYTCNGDAGGLYQQLQVSSPTATEEELNAMVQEKTTGLQKTTPALVTWQDWDWPCSDGDYCVFLAYGSKALYDQLAKDQKGETLFAGSIYYTQQEDGDAGELWTEEMPDKPINNNEEAGEAGILFYVFKSLHNDTIITTWDRD